MTRVSNPALVLVHGLGSAGTIWKSLISELEKDFTVYSIDLPGHGEATLGDDEKYDPRSLGEMILSYMQSVHKVLAPAGLWHEGPTMKIPPSIDARILAKISQFFMPLAFHLPPLKALGYRKITHLWRELSYETCRDSVIAMARAKGYKPLWQGLRGRKFDSPVDPEVKISVVFGDSDITLPEEIAQEKSILPKHAKWIRVPNCAHVIMWNHRETTIKLIKETAGI